MPLLLVSCHGLICSCQERERSGGWWMGRGSWDAGRMSTILQMDVARGRKRFFISFFNWCEILCLLESFFFHWWPALCRKFVLISIFSGEPWFVRRNLSEIIVGKAWKHVTQAFLQTALPLLSFFFFQLDRSMEVLWAVCYIRTQTILSSNLSMPQRWIQRYLLAKVVILILTASLSITPCASKIPWWGDYEGAYLYVVVLLLVPKWHIRCGIGIGDI